MAIEVFNSTRSPDLIGPIDSRHPPIEVIEFPAADPASISFANSSALGIFTPVPPNPNMGRRYRTTRKDRGIRTQKAFPFISSPPDPVDGLHEIAWFSSILVSPDSHRLMVASEPHGLANLPCVRPIFASISVTVG